MNLYIYQIFKPKIKTISTGIYVCSEALQSMVGYKNTCILQQIKFYLLFG